MTTIEELNKKLDDETKERKRLEIITNRLWEDVNNLGTNLQEEFEKNITKRQSNFDIELKEIKKIRDNIFSYTLQIIAIVVAIMAIVLTLTFLSFNDEIFVWIPGAAIIYFCVIITLIFLVVVWMNKDKIFKKKR